jgi:hypothetical protein
MHVELLVEGPSEEAALRNLAPKILRRGDTFDVHAFQGKHELLQKLPNRLKGYSGWLPEDWRIVVLVDQDSDDCRALKAQLESAAHSAGLPTRSDSRQGRGFKVLNRVAVEELEAWFFGDPQAVVSAYPRVQPSFSSKARYRDPDTIRGGTWEALERVLQGAGYHRAGLPKIAVARLISAHMDPGRNRSRSFRVFRSGLIGLSEGSTGICRTSG